MTIIRRKYIIMSKYHTRSCSLLYSKNTFSFVCFSNLERNYDL